MKSYTKHLLFCAVFVSGCTLGQEPAIPVAPPESPALLASATEAPYCPLDRVELILLEHPRGQVPVRVQAMQPPRKADRSLTPVRLVQDAQKAARIEPDAKGYFGQSGEHTYAWAPGKVYTVYLSKTRMTGIFLPPGERLVSSLYLDPESFDVKVERAGSGESAYDAVSVRPLKDSDEVEAYILTESSRRYMLRFVIGKVGMLAVTFEGIPTRQAQTLPVPAPLILPKPMEGSLP